jgi:hypothetical protein
MQPIDRIRHRPLRATLVVAALAVFVLVLAGLRSGDGRAAWTDGATIDVDAALVEPRSVLWRPAEPLRFEHAAASDADLDVYEPSFAADGSILVFVERRPGEGADLVVATRGPRGWSTPQPIDGINTEYDELSPQILSSPDGADDVLLFASNRPGGLGGFDLWRSTFDGARWSQPEPLGPSVNSRWNEYGPAARPELDQIFFASNRPQVDEPEAAARDGWSATIRERRQRNDYDLYAASLDGERAAARIDQLSTDADEGAPSISPAGDFLWFASDRPGGAGGFDLYRARLGTKAGDDVDVGPPESIDEAVNTAADELDPALAAEGFRLVFSSDRPLAADAYESGRFRIWTTTSREVERVERTASVASLDWWPSIPPTWLLLALLLALLALLAALLAWLLRRHDTLRRRLATMSVLAQCLLASLLLHALVGLLLAAWTVGSQFSAFLDAGGAPHRVLLTSIPAFESETDAASRNDVAAALAAQFALPLAATDLDALLEPITAAALEPSVRPSDTPTVAEAEAPAEPVQLDPIGGDARPSPLRIDQQAPAPPTVRADALEGIAIDATADVRTPTAPAVRPLAASSETANASTESAPPSPLRPAATLDEPLPHVQASLADAARANVPLPAQQTSALQAPIEERTRSSERDPGAAAPSASPSAPPLPAAHRAEEEQPVRLPARAPSRSLASEADEQPIEPVLPRSGAAPSVAPADAAGKPFATRDEVEIALPATSPSAAPEAMSGRSVASSTSAAAPAPVAALPEFAQPKSTSTGLVARLPPQPIAPPTPLETFAQRDRAVREQMLESMGGSRETEDAVERALRWMASRQRPDGSWSARENEGQIDADAAMTGLALLSFLGAGHTHDREGAHRATVERALQWLIERQRDDGDLRHAAAGAGVASDTMYGQTLATVALCEAYAMTRDPVLADPARRAVSFVLARAADARRGTARPEDTSVLGWLVMTIESARRAGFAPPDDVFRSARVFLEERALGRSRGRYAENPGGAASEPMTAESMFVQQMLGRLRTEQRMQESASFVLRTTPVWDGAAPTHHWYYATLALFEHQGEAWERWNAALMPVLLDHQRKDGTFAGSWDPQDRWSKLAGRLHQTAICTLCLEVYYRYRPR